jgi:hypothetical protein
MAIGLPYVHRDIGDGVARCCFDGAEDEEGCAVGIRGNGGAIRICGRIVGVKGPEHCAFGAGRRFWVVDGVNEERETYYVGEENEFLCRVQ